MPQINFARREILCKLVYYGPGISGKTTNLEVIHKRAPRDRAGELVNVATEGDRTLFFDYMPLDLGAVCGMRAKLQLYTVPGQPYYGSTRELVLRGADGVVFVADSQPDRMEANLESLADLEKNLREQGHRLEDVPLVIQWNKRDMPDVLPVDELERLLNPRGVPTFEAVAVKGEGVFQTLRKLTALTLQKLHDDYMPGAPVEAVPAPSPAARERAARDAARAREAAQAREEDRVHVRVHAPRAEEAPPAETRPQPRRRTPTPDPARRSPGRRSPVTPLPELVSRPQQPAAVVVNVSPEREPRAGARLIVAILLLALGVACGVLASRPELLERWREEVK